MYVLKQAIQEAQGNEERMAATGTLLACYNQTLDKPPRPGSQTYGELHKYIQMFLQCYDKATPLEKEKVHKVKNLDINRYRDLLKQLEQGMPLEPHPAAVSQTKKGCFVATAAFATPFAPEVIALRKFRDDVLNHSAFGRAFIRIYYFASPTIASVISSSKFLRAVSRKVFIHLVSYLQRRNIQ
jgi:hypothetical protein